MKPDLSKCTIKDGKLYDETGQEWAINEATPVVHQFKKGDLVLAWDESKHMPKRVAIFKERGSKGEFICYYNPNDDEDCKIPYECCEHYEPEGYIHIDVFKKELSDFKKEFIDIKDEEISQLKKELERAQKAMEDWKWKHEELESKLILREDKWKESEKRLLEKIELSEYSFFIAMTNEKHLLKKIEELQSKTTKQKSNYEKLDNECSHCKKHNLTGCVNCDDRLVGTIKPALADKKVGDLVYSINKNGEICGIKVSVKTKTYLQIIIGDRERLWIETTGVVTGFGNGQQLFFATKEEAEASRNG